MIKGLGNDIIEVSRIEGVISRLGTRFLNRVFTRKEQEYCLKHKESARNFAGRFAAKEAIVKALGSGLREGLSWLDIEILNDDKGKPVVYFSGKINEQLHHPEIMLSISHCKEYATAVAVLLK